MSGLADRPVDIGVCCILPPHVCLFLIGGKILVLGTKCRQGTSPSDASAAVG
jgi:hypothetical protein